MSTICLNVFAPLCSTYLNVFVPHIATLLCQRGISRVYSEENISLQKEGEAIQQKKVNLEAAQKSGKALALFFFFTFLLNVALDHF